MRENRELPAELKAIEAELAGLVPRTDEFDRERLIFLAGQASVGRTVRSPGKFARRMAWPMATAAMTTLAGALLVALVTKAEPETKTRIVYQYIQPPEATETDSVETLEAEIFRPETGPFEPTPAHESTLARALAWLDFPNRQRVHREVGYHRELDRMLDERAGQAAAFRDSSWPRSSNRTKRAAEPMTYLRLLESLTEQPGPNAGEPDGSATEAPDSAGVNS